MRKLERPQLPDAGDHNLLQLGISLWSMAVSRYTTSVRAIAVFYQVQVPLPEEYYKSTDALSQGASLAEKIFLALSKEWFILRGISLTKGNEP